MVSFYRPGRPDPYIKLITVSKTADESVANSTLQDDNHIFDIPLENARTYKVQAHLAFDASADGGGIKFSLITSQAVAESSFYVSMVDAARTVAADSYTTNTSTTALNLAFGEFADNSQPTFFINGFIEAHASNDGTLKLQWANNSGTNTLTLAENSWLSVEIVG